MQDTSTNAYVVVAVDRRGVGVAVASGDGFRFIAAYLRSARSTAAASAAWRGAAGAGGGEAGAGGDRPRRAVVRPGSASTLDLSCAKRRCRRRHPAGLSGFPCAGHDDGKEGTLAWHDAKPRSSLTSCWTSSLPAVIRKSALGRDGLVDELKRALAERALERRDGPPSGRRGGRRPGQQPQRLWPQDAAHRQRQAADRGAARPAGDLRSAADRQVPPAPAGLRRQDRCRCTPAA